MEKREKPSLIFQVKKTIIPGVVELGSFPSFKYSTVSNPKLDSYRSQTESLIKFMGWKMWGDRSDSSGWIDVYAWSDKRRKFDWHHDGFGDPDEHTIILMQISDPHENATEFAACTKKSLKSLNHFCDNAFRGDDPNRHDHNHDPKIVIKPFTLYAINNRTVAHRSPASSQGERLLMRCFVLGADIC